MATAIRDSEHYVSEMIACDRMNYPRVSEIISKQNGEFNNIPTNILENAQVRGEIIHDYCTAYVKGLWLPDIDPIYKPYLNAFMGWADENIHQTLFSNTRLYDDQKRFTGEFDMIVELKGSKQMALIDIKTSANVSKSWPLQLAAYKHLCEINGYNVECVMNIHLKKTKPGVVKAVQVEHTDLISAWEIFSSALRCYDYFSRKEIK